MADRGPRHQTASCSSSVLDDPRSPPPGGSAAEQHVQVPSTAPLTPEQTMPPHLEIENRAKPPPGERATEQHLIGPPSAPLTPAQAMPPEDFLQASPEEATAGAASTAGMRAAEAILHNYQEEAGSVAAAIATEHGEGTASLPKEKEICTPCQCIPDQSYNCC